MKIIEVEPIRTRRSTTLMDNEPCTDAAKDMAALTGISEVGKGECDYSGYFPGTSTFQLF